MSSVRTELEIAVRVTVDLTKTTSPAERSMLERTLALAKDMQQLRGTADPTVAILERQLAMLPVGEAPTPALAPLTQPHVSADRVVTGVLREAHRERQRAALVEALQQSCGNLRDTRERLGVSKATLTNWLYKFGIPKDHGRVLPDVLETLTP